MQVAHHLDREEDDLAVGIVIGCRQTVVLAQGICFELEMLVHHLLPFAVLQTVGVLVEHLRSAAAVVFAYEVQDACRFISLRFAELLGAPVAGVAGDAVYIVFARIPSHVHKLADRIFHRLEVAHVENPESVDAVLIGKRQLLPRVLHRGNIEHLRVSWRTHVIYVIVQSPTALVLSFLGIRHTAYVAPVVIAEQQGYVIRHLHALVVVIQYLFI